MKHKRIFAALSAAACAASVFSAMPLSLTAEAAALVSNDFEINYGGWYAESAEWTAELTAIEGGGFGGSRGMQITGRSDAGDGAVSEKDLYLVGGKRYDYSVRVFCETDQTFRLTLLTVDKTTGEETLKELDSKFVKGGTWETLSASYAAPANSKEFKLCITTDSTDDFVFDDVTIRGKQDLVAAAADTGLKDMLVNYGIRSGNIFNGTTIGDTDICNILLKDCNAIECENETKPDATLAWNGKGCTNTDIKVRDDSFAKIAEFCASHGLAFRGHTMVWHSQTPEWFFKENMEGNSGSYVSESVMNQRLESYIKNMFALYATKYPDLNLYAYDICNECMNDSNGGPRNKGYNNGNSPWVSVYGDNHFIDKAFEYARKYAPETCHLFYNDYNEYAGFKRDAIITTAKRIKAAGNLDGVGMQSHINANANDGWSGENQYLTAMKMYLEAGLEVQITELDISTDGGKYTLDQQANRYKNILKAAIDWNASHPSGARVTLFQVWGPNDNHSWVGTDKATGHSNQPLLYYGNNQPKPAYNALISLVPKSEWGDGTQFAGDTPLPEPELDSDGYWFHYTFENGTENFAGRSGAETLTSSGSEAFAGSKSLSVTDRESAWNGASTTLNTRIFKAGEKYSFSGNVKYTSGPATDKFHFTMQYKDADNETQYLKIATETVPKGQWVQLSNISFEIPAGASSPVIYFETDDSTTSFYVDEVIGAPEGKVIPGAGKGKQLILGDVDCDENITGKDLSALKQVIAGKWSDAIGELAADVDQSGEVDATDAKLLMQYLTKQITEFPVAERPFKDLSAQFNSIRLGTSLKKDNENNPLTTQRYGADPGWMVYKDRLYIYTTNDAFEYTSGGKLQINTYNSGTINCISSADLVNWTDHGPIPVADRNGRTTDGAAKWAGAAWAPDACWKTIDGKDKFFLYFANSAGGIGVLTADSPVGPWHDPLGHALITKSTPNCNDVEWMFDPGVYYDPTTDEGYIAFGGGRANNVPAATPGTGRIAKLGSDMISLEGNPVKMDTPYLFEDSSLIKIGDTWYYSYCSNWNVPGGTNINGVGFGNADILYMTSKNALGPWSSNTLKGNVFKNTATQRIDNGGNNHHSIIYFKGEYYVAYHSRQYALRTGLTFVDGGDPNNASKNSNDGNYRSTQLNKATFNPSTGQITCNGDMKGCEQIEALNPYEDVRAATMANQSGIQINGYGANTTVGGIDPGDWIQLKGVSFSKGCKNFTACASSQKGCIIEVLDGDGKAFAFAEIPAGGQMTKVTSATLNVSGTTDIKFVFNGDCEFDSWSFS